MKKRALLVISATFLVSILAVNVGFSDWLIDSRGYVGNGAASASFETFEPIKVAKVTSTANGTKYFTDIGAALKYAYESSADDSIYLIPGLDNDSESLNWSKTQVTLTSKYAANSSYSYDGKTYAQYIVASNDVLNIPYTEDTIFTDYQDGYGFIDSSIGSQQNNLKNELIIDEGVLLDIQGNLKIGGVMGGQSGTPDLQNTVQGQYAQISMKQNSKIVYSGSSSENNVYGYIKEYDETYPSDGIDVVSGAKFIMPLTCYDWTGGSWGSSILDEYFPILIYDFPSVQTKIRAYQGGTIQALADVTVSLVGHTQAYVNLVSTSSSYFLQMTGEGYVEFNWEPRSTVTTTTNGEERTIALTEDDASSAKYGNSVKEKVTIASNVTMNNLAVDISGYEMTTANKEIPLSYKIDITVKSGFTYTIPSSISAKFLPGSKVEVEEGATTNLEGKVIAYRNFNEKIRDGSCRYPTNFNVEKDGPGAQIINNGIINIMGSFGGLIQTTNTSGTARTVFSSASSYSATISEAQSFTSETTSIFGYTITSYDVVYGDVTESAIGNIYYANEYMDNAYFLNKGTDFVSTNISETDKNGNNYLANYWFGEFSEDSSFVNVVFDTETNDSETIVSFKVNYSDGTSTTVTGNAATVFEVPNGLTFTISDLTGADSLTLEDGTNAVGSALTPYDGMTLTAVASATYYTMTLDITNGSLTITSSDTTIAGTYKESKTLSIKKGTQFTLKYTLTYTNSTTATINNESISTTDTYTATGDISIKLSSSSSSGGGCLLPGTLITMGDGSTKPVEEIQAGDYILAFNHETGKKEPSMVLFNDHEEKELVNVLYLDFSGKEVGVIYEHGFFDLTLNEYVYIDASNYLDFIGHEFAYIDESGSVESRTLSSAYVREEVTECYSPVTYSTLNYFTEDMLSMPGGISGLFNIFEYDPDTLAYDEEKKIADINEYGLFTYEDFKDTGLTEQAFDAYNGQYLKVSIGKGLITWEEIAYLIERYSKYF